MANDLNQCNFIGRLGKDPEVVNGNITKFSIACGWKTKEKEGTEWINCVAFGKQGEICAQYLKKGAQVYLSGKFKTDTYEKDGIKRYSTSIVVDHMQMVGSKSDNADGKSGNQWDKHAPVDNGEDIPF